MATEPDGRQDATGAQGARSARDAAGDAPAPAPAVPSVPGGRGPLGRLALFAPVAVVWLALDLATKAWFNQFPAGTVAGGPFLGLIRFRVAHNTGGAWGMFGDATVALGVLSLVVCAGLLAYVVFIARRPSALELLGAALVFAGGLGNAIDRFTLGYVVDFIDPVFIDFPTFNVADIGVTCGFVIFFLALALGGRQEGDSA